MFSAKSQRVILWMASLTVPGYILDSLADQISSGAVLGGEEEQ